MHLRELHIEGVVGCPDPSHVEVGGGHVVVRGGDLLFPLLRYLLLAEGAGPPAGRITWTVEGPGGDAQTLVVAAGSPRPTAPWLPDPEAARALLWQEGPLEAGAPALSPDELARILRQLESELEAATEVERLEAEVERLEHELASLEQRLAGWAEVERRAKEAEARLAPFESAEVPADLPARLDAYLAARAKRDDREARLRAALEAARPGEATPLGEELRRPRFWAGLGVGLATLVAGWLSPWNVLALLAIPSFGVSAVVALAGIVAVQERERAGKRRKVLEDQLQKLEEAWEAEGRDVHQAMEALGLESVEELRAWLEQREAARAQAAAALGAWAAAEEDPERISADSMRRRIAQRRDEAADALVSLAAGVFRSRDELLQQKEEVRRLLAEGASPPFDPSIAWLDAAARLLGVDRGELLGTLGPAASQLLSALTNGAWTAVGWGQAGGVACKGASGVKRFGELPREERELVRASLCLAAAARFSSRGLGLLVLDRAFDALPPERQAALARALRWAGDRGVQILHRATGPTFEGAAHRVVEAP